MKVMEIWAKDNDDRLDEGVQGDGDGVAPVSGDQHEQWEGHLQEDAQGGAQDDQGEVGQADLNWSTCSKVRCDTKPHEYDRQGEHDQLGQEGAGGQGDHRQELQDSGVHDQDTQDNKDDHTGKELYVHLNNIDYPGKPVKQCQGGDHGQGEGSGHPQHGGVLGQGAVRLQQCAVQDQQERGHDGGVDSRGGGHHQVQRGAAGRECQLSLVDQMCSYLERKIAKQGCETPEGKVQRRRARRKRSLEVIEEGIVQTKLSIFGGGGQR